MSLIDPRDDRQSVPYPIPDSLDIALNIPAGPRPLDDFIDGYQGHAPLFHFGTPPIALSNGYNSTAGTYSIQPFEGERLDPAMVDYNRQPFFNDYDPPQTRTASRRSQELINGQEEDLHHTRGDNPSTSAEPSHPRRSGRRRREIRVPNGSQRPHPPSHNRVDVQPSMTTRPVSRQTRRERVSELYNGTQHQPDNEQMDLASYSYAPPPPERRMTRAHGQLNETQGIIPYDRINIETPPPIHVTPRRRTNGHSNPMRRESRQQGTMVSRLPTAAQEPADPHGQESYFPPPEPFPTYDHTHLPPLSTAATQNNPYVDDAPPWSPGPPSSELHARRQSLLPLLGFRDPAAQGVGDEEGVGMESDLDLLGVPQPPPINMHSGEGVQRHRDRRYESVEKMDVDIDDGDDEDGEDETGHGSQHTGRKKSKRRRSSPSTTVSNGHASKRRHSRRG